jgi:hypothetical protein
MSDCEFYEPVYFQAVQIFSGAVISD